MEKRFYPWFRCHLFAFVALVCVAHLLLFQKPLLSHAISVSQADLSGAINIISLQILQFCLLASLLLVIAALSEILLKILCSLLFLANAAALYFMLTYGIEIDLSMIQNILGTDTGEAGDLLHWKLLVYLLLLGIVPSILIWTTALVRPRWYKTLLGAVGVFGLLLAWLFATSFTWLWYDAHATRLGSRILPWSYVVNTARHYNREASRNREQVLLPDAVFLTEVPETKEIVVLVIGEAARADNFAHYGYDKDTNPFTMQTDLVALPVGQSCATYTIGATACITTHEGRAASSRTIFEPLASYLTRHGIETIFRNNNNGMPPTIYSSTQRARDIAATCTGAECPNGRLDEALNWGLADLLEQSTAQRIFVTLHQTGSHGPSYHKKYPPAFEHFTPVCKTVQVADCSAEELQNAYDNTIRYTDYLLADLITQLEGIANTNAVMIYVSDHGQSLGEDGVYLHGVPLAVAPAQQRRVPFLVWMSDGFKESRNLNVADIIPTESFPHDFPFHSVMGALGMRSDIYKPEYDVFSNGMAVDTQ